MDACLEALQQAFRGEPFAFEGRPVRVLPRPLGAGRAAAFCWAATAPRRCAARRASGSAC